MIRVNEITQPAIGRVELRRCGNEGRAWRQYMDNEITTEAYQAIETTRRILRAAMSFIPDAEEDGAVMTNTAFILSIPGRDFAIKAGNGDWEYIFEKGEDGEIYGRNVRETFFRYVYRTATNMIQRFSSFVANFLPLVGSRGRRALTDH